MPYDAREYLQALTPPEFIAPDGHTYQGRLLSHHQLAEVQAALAEAAGKRESDTMLADVEVAFRHALSLLFPEPAAVDAILSLPPQGVQEAMVYFLACQRRPVAGKPAAVEAQVVGSIQPPGSLPPMVGTS